MRRYIGLLEANSSSTKEMMIVQSQELGRMVFDAICAACGLLILGMAANEWRRLRLAEYGRMAIAAGVLLAGRIGGSLALQTGFLDGAACPEWALEGLTLALFMWAYLFATFSDRRWVFASLVVGLVAVGAGLAFCLLDDGGLFPAAVSPGGGVLLLLSGYGLFRWLRYRQRSSLWVGGALFVAFLGAAAGLFREQPVVPVSHAVALGLFVVETYRSILSDARVLGRELESASEQVVHQSQELAFLLELGETVVASLDLPVVLEQASEAVARAANADWGYVLLPLDDSVHELSVAARYGWWGRRRKQDAQVHRPMIIRLGDFSLLRHAINLRRQVLANDPRDFEQFDRLHDLLGRPQSGPTLVQPICSQDRILGAMLLGHVDKQQTFSQADGRLCQALVAQVAVAIENARLYQETEERSESLAKLLLKRREEAAQRLSILESIADGVLVANDSGELLFVNEAAGWILGLPGEQLVGDTILRLYSALRAADEQDGGERAVVAWNDKALEGTLAPVRAEDGTLLGHVAVFHDVTGQNRSELARNEYIASVSQELRVKLASVQGSVEQMKRAAVGQAPAGYRESLEMVSDDAERMAGLVNSLIAMSETEPGTIQINAQPVDMKAVIAGAVEAVRARAAKASLDIRVDLPTDLSPAWGDPQALRQIMDNLLDNALRFTPEGGRLSIWAAKAFLQNKDESAQAHLVISIRDTGVGIPPEEQDRIFAKFYRLKPPLPADDEGTGLGLTVVRSLVEAHGGQILVESEPGEGSTFSLAIPAAGQD